MFNNTHFSADMFFPHGAILFSNHSVELGHDPPAEAVSRWAWVEELASGLTVSLLLVLAILVLVKRNLQAISRLLHGLQERLPDPEMASTNTDPTYDLPPSPPSMSQSDGSDELETEMITYSIAGYNGPNLVSVTNPLAHFDTI